MKAIVSILAIFLMLFASTTCCNAEPGGEAVLESLVELRGQIVKAKQENPSKPFEADLDQVKGLEKLRGMEKGQIIERLRSVPASDDRCTAKDCEWRFYWLPPDHVGGGPTLHTRFDTNERVSEVFGVIGQ